MKNLMFLLIVLVLYSCGKEPYDLYVLENETEYNLVIQGFSHRGLENNKFIVESEIIELDPYSSKTEKVYFGEGGSSQAYFTIGSVDSVRVVFNEGRLLILECGLNNKNDCHSIFGVFEASITQEDYEKAIPIENN